VPDNPPRGSWRPRRTGRSTTSAADGASSARTARSAGPRGGAREAVADLDAALDDDIGDDLLRLVFTSCHPVLSREARVALTLRLLGGSRRRRSRGPISSRRPRSPAPRAREAHARGRRVPFEVPRGPDRDARLSSVLEVVYLIFNEAMRRPRATIGCAAALRGGAPARPDPRDPRAFGARGPRPRRAHGDPGLADEGADRGAGEPILLLDQDRGRWDHLLIGRGSRRSQRPKRPASRAYTCRPRSPPATRGPGPPARRTGADRGPLRRARAGGALARGRSEPGRRGRNGRGAGRGPRSRGRAPRREALEGYHSFRACAGSLAGWAARRGAGRVRKGRVARRQFRERRSCSPGRRPWARWPRIGRCKRPDVPMPSFIWGGGPEGT